MKNDKPKLIVLGPLSGPLTGEVLALQILVQSRQFQEQFKFRLLDRRTQNRKRGMALLVQLLLFPKLLFYMLFFRPDLLYLSLGQSARGITRDYFILNLCKRFHLKTIGHLHGGGFSSMRKNQTKVSRKLENLVGNLDVAIVLGEKLRNQFAFSNFDGNVRIVRNCCKLPKDYTATSKTINSPNSHIKILFLSNVLPEKGLCFVLDALSIMDKKKMSYAFKFAGDIFPTKEKSIPQVELEITEKISSLNKAKIEVVGPASFYQKWQLLHWADIVILPSLWTEGQPIVLIEALYAGCVVLATDQGGISEIIDEGKNGFLIPPNSQIIAEKIEWICNNPHWFATASLHSLQKAKTDFSHDAYIQNLITAFKETILLN